MSRFKIDLHMHSCLSPCADDDMTPATMAGMAALAGVRIAALTDHNASGNCPAFFKACDAYGVIPIAGMELTTSEDVHMVCLFPELSMALEFDKAVFPFRLKLSNKPLIFGNQRFMDSDDNVIGEDPYFLPAATSLSISEGCEMVKSFGGVCYPAHIDREANGILTMLGAFPPEPKFSVVELHDACRNDLSEGRPIVASSDAHHLLDIGGNDFFLDLNADANNTSGIVNSLFAFLRGGGL